MKKFTALFLSAVLSTASFLPTFAADQLTKGEYARMLLEAAEDYNEGLQISDFFKGDGKTDTSGNPITKAEALAMLRRAFGTLPSLTGDLLRTAPEMGSYTDVPVWAQDDIAKLSMAGVLSETPGGELGSGDYVDEEYADTMFARMYRLFGSNPKDDFYSYVNHDFLVTGTIDIGVSENSVFQDINNEVAYELVNILADIINKNHVNGSPEQKIKDFYLTAADEETRNELGAEPIMPYLEQLREAENDEELTDFAISFAKDTTMDLFAGFSVTMDYADQSVYLPVLDTYGITMVREDYENEERLEDFKEVIVTLFTLGGNDEKTADEKADMVVDFEKELAKHTRSTDEYTDIEDAYNYYTLSELQAMFGTLDLQEIADVHGFDVSGDIVVADPDALEFYASYFDGSHTELLKTLAEISLLATYSTMLDEEFMEANNSLLELVYGYNPEANILTEAFNTTSSAMETYLGRIYYENNMDEEKTAEVRSIAESIIEVYKTRIAQQDWMSETTKAEAIKKLDNMDLIIGMKEDSTDFMKDIDIKGIRDGGTYLDNIYAIMKENDKVSAAILSGDFDNDEIYFSAYLVNASYYPMANTFVLPAGILNEPIYSLDASLSQNYGALGCVIGHEISHAFDTTGAKFDEKGNYNDWWTAEDYAAFEKLSKEIVDYYDGAEVATGIETDGEFTLDENIADISGVRCALDALKSVEPNPDYEEFFESYATIFRSTSERSVLEAYNELDTHSASDVRVNYALRCIDEFFDTYDINEGDGMYLPEDERVGIW